MHRKSFRIWLVMPLVLAVAPVQGQSKNEKPENAALKYWQAFALLPRLDAERLKIIEDRNTIPFDEATRKLLEDTKPSITLLLRGASIRGCDWGLDLLADGPQTRMPHVDKARELANHALLHARWQFERSHFADGIDTTTALLTLARHLGTDGTLISLLVERNIEQQCMRTLACYLPDFGTEANQRLTRKLDELPRGATSRSAILRERDGMAGWMLRHLQTENLGVGASLQAIVQAAGGPKGPTKQLEELMAEYEEMARILSLPRDQFEPRWTTLCKKLETNPFARQLMPSVEKIYESDERAKATWAMFHAARAVVQNGPNSLKDHPDPSTNEPFAYVTRSGGFELKSKLTAKGKAVKLVVGRAGER